MFEYVYFMMFKFSDLYYNFKYIFIQIYMLLCNILFYRICLGEIYGFNC